MQRWMIAALLGVSTFAAAQEPNSTSKLKSILLQQLRDTHNEKNWFVSEKQAVAGLSSEQAAWSDGKNHSVGQLVNHLNYWNSAHLANFKHQPAPKVPDNDATFAFDPKQWDAALKEFDQVMTELEALVQSSDDTTLAKIARTIGLIAEHNAYHIGEMVTSRKRQGSWDPDIGVK